MHAWEPVPEEWAGFELGCPSQAHSKDEVYYGATPPATLPQPTTLRGVVMGAARAGFLVVPGAWASSSAAPRAEVRGLPGLPAAGPQAHCYFMAT